MSRRLVVIINLEGKNIAIVGGAGLVGSHTLEAILKEDVAKYESSIILNVAR
ncbi:hypothetical protein Brsp01_31560 [Brucella sp. NBRC 12950]|nr:hypothetical protein Brsp01_31560 [Brucella sp. NBRC 12950]